MLINESTQSSPRAHAIFNAAIALDIPINLIIDSLQSEYANDLSFSTPRERFYAIASPLASSDDDFDDMIHELSHLIPNATMRCDECNECDLCCDC